MGLCTAQIGSLFAADAWNNVTFTAGEVRDPARDVPLSLLRRFPELRLAVPFQELHWSHGDGLVLRGLSELPIVPGHAAAHPLAV